MTNGTSISLVVNPDFQNHGIGTKLLNALPEYAKARDLKMVGLLVDDLNPTQNAFTGELVSNSTTGKLFLVTTTNTWKKKFNLLKFSLKYPKQK